MDENLKANSATDHENWHSETPKFNATSSSAINTGCSMPSEDSLDNSLKQSEDILGAQILFDSSIGRSHSSLSQRSPIVLRNSSLGTLTEAIESYHSLPLSMLEVSMLMHVLVNVNVQTIKNITLNRILLFISAAISEQ